MIHPSSVPSEFVGLARAFRARIGAEDDAVGRGVLEIMKPLHARRRRSATFRPADLQDAERQFRNLPSAGRLTLKIDRDRKGLLIEEIRAASGKMRFCEWADDAADLDIGINLISLEAVSWGRIGAFANIVCSVSLHALARRMQRGFNNTDAAILSEMKQLALLYPTIIDAMGDFSIGGDGGRWVGEVARTTTGGESVPALAIRSFTPAGALVTGTMFGAVAIA
jgi:hypothetical protein